MNKYQEALDKYGNHYWAWGNDERFQADIKTLQELVDRATPKKPVWEHAYMCDACFNQEVNSDMNFCPNCGQAIDKSEIIKHSKSG